MGVDVVNQLSVAVFDGPSANLHGVSEGAVLRRKFVRYQDHSLQPLKSGKILVQPVHDPVIEGLNLGTTDQLHARREDDLIVTSPVFEQGKIKIGRASCR